MYVDGTKECREGGVRYTCRERVKWHYSLATDYNGVNTTKATNGLKQP